MGLPSKNFSEVDKKFAKKRYTKEYFGDLCGRGGKLSKKGFERSAKSTMRETWVKKLSDGTTIEINYDAERNRRVMPMGETHEALSTITKFAVEFTFPDTQQDDEPRLIRVFEQELGDLFLLNDKSR